MTDQPLSGRCVIVPESRELDLFSSMLTRQGAAVIRCPLVRIRALTDFAALDAWSERLIAGGHDLLAFYTGEGVMRIADRAEELGRRDELVAALARPLKLARGPKPVSALRRLGLATDAVTREPTTGGLIDLLGTLELGGQTVAVQLYPGAPDERLGRAIRERGGEFDPVLPYSYASDESDDEVATAIHRMAEGSIDLIAFTSKLQIHRLIDVAERRGIRSVLDKALAATAIAAIGPVTAQALAEAGGKVAISPEVSFHLKPLVAKIVRELGSAR